MQLQTSKFVLKSPCHCRSGINIAVDNQSSEGDREGTKLRPELNGEYYETEMDFRSPQARSKRSRPDGKQRPKSAAAYGKKRSYDIDQPTENQEL